MSREARAFCSGFTSRYCDYCSLWPVCEPVRFRCRTFALASVGFRGRVLAGGCKRYPRTVRQRNRSCGAPWRCLGSSRRGPFCRLWVVCRRGVFCTLGTTGADCLAVLRFVEQRHRIDPGWSGTSGDRRPGDPPRAGTEQILIKKIAVALIDCGLVGFPHRRLHAWRPRQSARASREFAPPHLNEGLT
jgi:hypothetical protein